MRFRAGGGTRRDLTGRRQPQGLALSSPSGKGRNSASGARLRRHGLQPCAGGLDADA